MAFDPDKARVANQLIRDGLDPALALGQAGVAPRDRNLYTIDEVGTPETNPNYGQLVSTSFARVQAESPDVVTDRVYTPNLRGTSVRRIRTAEETTTTQTTQITGGGSTTRRVVPTQYEDNASSRAIQAEANDLEAQKQARATAIKAAGGTGADVLRDPEYRRLSNEQTAKEYEAQQARTAVPNTGGIVTTVEPGANQTITTQTVDGNFVTNRGSGFDPQSQAVEANTDGFVPARNFSAQDVTADDVAAVRPIEDDIEGGAVGFPEGTFAGNGYGFVYDEDGNLIPADSADADRIRSTPADTQDEFAGSGYGFTYDEDGELIPAEDPFTPDSFDPNDVTPDSDPALETGRFATATADDIAPVRQPQPPLGLTYQYNDVDGYDIFDADGNYITTVNDEAQAILYIQDAEAEGLGFANTRDAALNQDTLARAEQQAAGSATQAALKRAQDQATIQQRYNQTTQGDWRVIIRLAPEADYLYKDTANTLLKPLFDSDGVIFPYTPTITTAYVARYDPYELVHANYRGFFYRNSHVSDLQVNGVFTAQDTAEASYLLAVIHFFRSCTKMFYGQDQNRGTPPPIVELSGYGQYQFNNHPCLVSNFNYTLPNGVDYIRVTPNNQGLNLQPRRNPISAGSSVTISSVINRLSNAGLPKGAESGRLDLGTVAGTVNGTIQDTYVPTKIEIQLTLLPVQTRKQVSQLYSTKEFANGNLLRGGFW